MNDLFGTSTLSLPFEMPRGEGYRVSWNERGNGFDIKVPDGELFYSETFFSRKASDRLVEYFQENEDFDWRSADWRSIPADDLHLIRFRNIKWKQDWIKFYGKSLPLPRLTSWYGDSGRAYTYSGIKSEPNPWNEGLLYVKERIEKFSEVEFNSVLLNWYRDGNDHLSWHSDDEKELGLDPIIGSANFGTSRDFLIRRKDDNAQRVVLPLRHGTFLLMKGKLQHFWQHSIPKRKNVRGSRFNLTFRRIGLDSPT